MKISAKITSVIISLTLVLAIGNSSVSAYQKPVNIVVNDESIFMVQKNLKTGEVSAQSMDSSASAMAVPEVSVQVTSKDISQFSSEIPEKQPRVVIGPDNRTLVTNTQTSPYSAICMIKIYFPNG